MYFRGFSARMPFEKGYTDSKLNGISMGWNNKRSTGNRVYARFMTTDVLVFEHNRQF